MRLALLRPIRAVNVNLFVCIAGRGIHRIHMFDARSLVTRFLFQLAGGGHVGRFAGVELACRNFQRFFPISVAVLPHEQNLPVHDEQHARAARMLYVFARAGFPVRAQGVVAMHAKDMPLKHNFVADRLFLQIHKSSLLFSSSDRRAESVLLFHPAASAKYEYPQSKPHTALPLQPQFSNAFRIMSASTF